MLSFGRVRVAVLFLLLLSAPAAFADNTADEADLAFQLGNEAYAKGSYAEALRHYFVSYRLVPNKNVLYNIARCYESLERFDEAYRYFNDLLASDLPEEDERDIQKSLARIRPRVALLKVTSVPPGADVYIDREDLGSRGRAPLSLALPPGKHTVIAKLEGYHPAAATVALTRGREVSQDFELDLVVGKILLRGSPAGAQVREKADGPVVATLPGELSLPPGKHLLIVTAPRHVSAQYLVDVRAQSEARVDVALAPQPLPTGRVIVTANRENALVRVDGKESGFTPTVLTLPEGEHTLELTYKDLRPHQQRIRVTRDTEMKLAVELRYAPPPVQAASKRLLSVDDAPASTTVISSEEIRAFGYTSLAEALQAVRGVFISDDRQYQYLGVRGFSPPGDLNTRVLILWDGHAMNDVWAGQGYAGRDLAANLEEIERIEVVRGPGSALYGTGAFFAVINVVPRNRVEPRRNVEVTGGVGGMGLARGHVAAALGEDPRRTGIVSFSGMAARNAESTDLGEVGVVRGLDGERVLSGGARARLGDLTLHAYLNSRRKEVPTAPFNAALNLPGSRIFDARGFIEARYDHDFSERTAVSARAYYDASRYDAQWPYAGLTADAPATLAIEAGGADWSGGEARVRLTPFSGNELTFGVEGQYQARIYQAGREKIGDNEIETRSQTSQRTLVSAYLLDEWRPHQRVTVSAGLRVDRYLDLNVTPVNPRLALILRPYDGGLTKIVAGTAFRAPNVYELTYQDFPVSQRIAQDLEPETIQTIELEHSHDLTEEMRLTLSGYANRIQKLVALTEETLETPECGEPAGTVQCIRNVNLPGTLQALGAEVEARWQPGRFALVDVSYSFVNIRAIDSDISVENMPVHLAAGRLMVPLVESAVRLSTQVVYQSRRRSDRVPQGAGEAVLLNVGFSGERDHFRYFAGVQNALDQPYALPLNNEHREATVPQYGRTFLIQVTGTY